MDEQVFADGIGTISVIGGTVRVDLVTYSPTEKDASGQPLAVFRQRIIMGSEAFLHAAEKIQEAAQALTARIGRITPLAAVPAAPTAPAPAPVEPQPPPAVPVQKPPFP